jgi:hypothetical protein
VIENVLPGSQPRDGGSKRKGEVYLKEKEMIEYLQTQTHRMSDDQKDLVARCASRHEDEWIKIERDRLTTLYMWLHMKPDESVWWRKF